MHEIELITRSGPIILMSPTRKGLYNAFKRFLSSDSLALVDEPDEIEVPLNPDTNSYNKLKGQSAIS